MRSLPRAIAASVFVLALAACAPTNGTTMTPQPGSPTPTSVLPTTIKPLPPETLAPTVPAGTPAEVPAARTAAIVHVLTERKVDASAMKVVKSESVVWPDGSWGCPEPGMAYPQVTEEGMHVIVEAGGRFWDFRFGQSDTPVLCEGQTLNR